MFKVFQRPTERHTTTLDQDNDYDSSALTWECELLLSGGQYLHLDFGGPILPVEFVEKLLGYRPVCVKVRFGNWYLYRAKHRLVVTNSTITVVDNECFQQADYALENSSWRHMRACSWEYTDSFTYTCWLISVEDVPLVFDVDREKRKAEKLAEYRRLRDIDKIVDEIERESKLAPEPVVDEDDELLRIAQMSEEELKQLGLYE